MEEDFEELKKAINECPKLFFLRNEAPVYLHTDASNHAIGGYLFQLIDGKEYPIRFFSKSLDETQRKWSTPEKEMFAIYISVKMFDYLLSDRHFELRTNHENLTKLNDPKYLTSKKVLNWKLEIQKYDS